MSKPDFCICENKGADQLHGNRVAYLSLCFPYIGSTIPLLPKSEFEDSSHLLWLYSQVCDRLVGNPKERFSHDAAHMVQSGTEFQKGALDSFKKNV